MIREEVRCVGACCMLMRQHGKEAPIPLCATGCSGWRMRVLEVVRKRDASRPTTGFANSNVNLKLKETRNGYRCDSLPDVFSSASPSESTLLKPGFGQGYELRVSSSSLAASCTSCRNLGEDALFDAARVRRTNG